jgi:hypothetical protein
MLKRGQHRKDAPYAFKEQGIAMLSSVLRSPRAIEVNIQAVFETIQHPGRVITPEQLESLGLLAKPEPVKTTTVKFTRGDESTPAKDRQWPSYERALAGAPRVMMAPTAAEPTSGFRTSPCSVDGVPRRRRLNSWR